jgi:hypothetical protein
MYTQEYEFTAVHEAGHTVCVEHFPPEPSVSTLQRLVITFGQEQERSTLYMTK